MWRHTAFMAFTGSTAVGRAAFSVWKAWHAHFSRRDDFDALTREIGDALLAEFDRGDHATRVAVAMLFGRGEAEAALSTIDFRRAVKLDEWTLPMK